MRVFCSSESLLKSSRAGIEYCIPRAVAAIVSWCDLRARRNKCWSETAVCAVRFRAATRMQMSTNRREEKERQQKEKGKKEKKKRKKDEEGRSGAVMLPKSLFLVKTAAKSIAMERWFGLNGHRRRRSSRWLVAMPLGRRARAGKMRRGGRSKERASRESLSASAAYASAAAAQEPTAASQL